MTESTRATRGHGLLEGFLARQRAATADSLIPDSLRAGRILDVGCGTFPYFLSNTRFAEKYGIDRLSTAANAIEGIDLRNHDLASGEPLPYDDAFFDAVTMLAVFEHVDRSALQSLVQEIHRVLKPGGRYVLTTPASWTDPILKTLAALRLVSAEEIDEHQPLYGLREIESVLVNAGFSSGALQFGRFELGLNTYAVAAKA